MLLLVETFFWLAHKYKLMQKVESVSLFFSFQGVSILVTSVTDVCAFFIGATTVSYFSESICFQDMFSNQNTQQGYFWTFFWFTKFAGKIWNTKKTKKLDF